MFRLLFGLAALVFAQGLFAQNTFRRDSMYTFSGIPNTQMFAQESKSYFSYNQEGRVDSISIIPAIGDAKLRSFDYVNGKIAAQQDHVLGVDLVWRPVRRVEYAYNPEGRLSIRLIQQAPAPGLALENLNRRLFSYNDNGQRDTITQQRWVGGQWANIWQQAFAYNQEEEITQRLLRKWTGSTWQDFERRMWTYDPNGFNAIAVMTQRWDNAQQIWVNRSRKMMDYNAGGLWTGTTVQTWDNDEGDWKNEDREAHLYTPLGAPEAYIYQFWNDTAWVNGVRELAVMAGNQYGNVVDQWSMQDSTWVTQFRYRNRLDDQGLIVESISRQYWDMNAQEWENDVSTVKREIFWSEVVTAIENPGTLPTSCVLPNPYRSGQTLHCPGISSLRNAIVEIYDLSGKTLFRLSYRDGMSLPAHIQPGLYALRIQAGNKTLHLQKLVISQ